MKINLFSLAAVLLVSWLAGSNVGRAQVPTISVGPTNQVLPVGGTLALGVTAGGGTPLAYQWFKDSRWLLGATNNTLTVANAGVTNSGMYYVVVTNLGGMVISLPTSVVVGNPAFLAWGWNNNGQLGNGVTNNSSLPVGVASNVVTGAVGGNHSLFVTADGTLWAMGNNQYGQLGNGTNTEANLPVSVASNVVAVAAGLYHSLFVTADGTLWAMGNNQYGQLGNGTTNAANVPVAVASNVVAVAAGANHSLFVTANGTLYSMGNNLYGQLGNGTYYNTNLPVAMASNVVAVAAGISHSLFITANGMLWAMGYNNYGQLGTYGFQVSIPEYVASNVVAVAAGASHSLFIKTNGTLWAMGLNVYGQLGNGTATGGEVNSTPENVASNVVTVAAGAYHSLFVETDGTLWAMGNNQYGQLGNGTTNEANTPVNVPQLYAASLFPGSLANHSLATAITLYPPTITSAPTNQVLAVGGTLTLSVTATTVYPAGPPVYQWFKDSRRLLGATNSTLTVANAGMTNSGTYYVVATNGDGIVISTPVLVAVGTPALAAFGDDNFGQLGNGLTRNGSNPVPYTVTGNVVTGAAGYGHSLFVTADGTLWAMGWNGSGQFGNGTTISTNLPVSVASNVVAVAAGDYHSLFVTSDGTLWAVGENQYGQLGYGPTGNQDTPVSVASNVVAVAAGMADSFFLKTDGTLWSMGYDTYGQLGNGTSSSQNPLPVNVASDVVAVAAGDEHSLFVKANGTLWAMGYNYYGQLGNGTTSNTNQPVNVASNVVAVAAGYDFSLFIKTNGTLWGMGDNGIGQLGNGTSGNSSTPISLVSNVMAVAAGADHSLFVKTDGTLWAMGANNYGQLGIYQFVDEEPPVNIPHVIAANVFAGEEAEHSLVMGSNYNATVTLSNLNQPFNGSAISVSVSTRPAGLAVILTYNGSVVAPTNEGNYKVVGIVSDPVYYGTATNTLVIETNATITLGNLNQNYTGGAISVTATSTPPGLTVNLTYNGSTVAPTNPGDYTVVGTLNGPLYYGSVTNTLVISWLTAVPTNQMVAAGETLTLSVTASGPAPAYQWFKNSQLLLGATNSMLTVTNTSTENSGIYYVVLNNGSAMVISPPVSVVVGDPILLAWGWNYYGQLGDGTTVSADLPVTVATNVVVAAAGYNDSMFVTGDGTLWAMGFDNAGQLGNSTSTESAQTPPFSVTGNVVAAAAGFAHTMFVTTNGVLFTMGEDFYGQLGNGTTTSTIYSPVYVASNVVAVAAGSFHSLFVTTAGKLWAMGNDSNGQLGNGTTSNASPTPFNVASNVVAVAAGSLHSLFVKADGTLWAMGANSSGQLGDGTTNDISTPVSVASNVVAVAAGTAHSLFATADGTLWAMGNNGSGQLGDGTTNEVSTPVDVASNVVTVAAGGNFSLFVKTDGTLWAMGDNTYGQLGNGTNGNYYTTPVCVPHLSAVSLFPVAGTDHSLALGFYYTANMASLSGGVPSFTFVGLPGASYNVERSMDLINWTVIWTTNEPANGIFQFTDPDAPLSNAYYQLQPGQ